MMTTAETLLAALATAIRRDLEGGTDGAGRSQPGDFERRLATLGIRAGRKPVPVVDLPQLSPEDRTARTVVDAYLVSRAEAGVDQTAAITELVRNAAYTWANRLFALRCMEARGLIDEVILQKAAYGGRSLKHHRLAKKEPARCAGEDDGLFAVLFDEFAERAKELPLLFDPSAPEVAIRPSVAALKRAVALLSGTEILRGLDPATDDAFTAPDAIGWTYQYWNGDEKDRVFEVLRTQKGAKIGGPKLVPATCIYTPSYLVQFLVQNSLGALWASMHPGSRLSGTWEYYVADADTTPRAPKPVRDIRFLDPACGSGHFLLEAFDLFYAMYLEEGTITDPAEICASILERNLYGIDIDERAVQIAALALVMRAKEKVLEFSPRHVNLVATNIRLPSAPEHVAAFLRKHPEDAPLKPALMTIFEEIGHAGELGSLIRIEDPVERALSRLQQQQTTEEKRRGAGTLFGPRRDDDWAAWRRDALERLGRHFAEEADAADLATAFFGEAAQKSLSLVELLTRRYDVVAMNPPYIGFRKLAPHLKDLVTKDPLAKLDIYIAFLSRAFSLLEDGGLMTAVSPASWTTGSSVAQLRRRMLDEGGPTIIAALGQRVFDPAPLLFVSLQVITRNKTRADRHVMTLRPATASGANGLRQAIQHGAKKWPHEVLRGLETLPFLPVAPLELLQKAKAQPTVGDFFSFTDGVWTGSNERDVREAWEVRNDDIRWVAASGGQGYRRWYAPFFRRVRGRYVEGWSPAPARAFALEYARVAGGKLAARIVRTRSTAIAGIVTLVSKEGVDPRRLYEAAAVFNSRLGTVWLRTLTSGLNFNPGYAARIPLGTRPPSDDLVEAVKRVVASKQAGAALDIACDDFAPDRFGPPAKGADADLAERMARLYRLSLEQTAAALEQENAIEQQLKTHLAISDDAWQEIELELGKPVAVLSEVALAGAPNAPLDGQGEDAEEEEDGAGARTLPSESELEAISRAHGVNPRHLIEHDELPEPLAAAMSDLRVTRTNELVQDYLCFRILRLFGHTWPRENVLPEGLSTPPSILPLTQGVGTRTVIERLRDSFDQDFPGCDPAAIERELAGFLRKPVERWIEADFFRWHVARFGRRPIVWQIQSAPRKPVFSALVYSLRLDDDTLPTVLSHHLGPLDERFETELRGLESLRADGRTAGQVARVTEIVKAREELATFTARIKGIDAAGFAYDELSAKLGGEPLDAWTSRDGRHPVPPSPEAFLVQERRYDPQLDDGVRVNVAPLQKAGILAADVLAAKDIDRAIADRAEWRADERRLCREGQLGRPGWWPADESGK